VIPAVAFYVVDRRALQQSVAGGLAGHDLAVEFGPRRKSTR
jgi:hypothetical protein